MNMTSSITHPPFIKSAPKSNHFLIPSLPFSVWDGDILVWASDERHAQKLTRAKREKMANEAFIMNGKEYTVVCEEHQSTHAALLAHMIQTSVAGEKDKNALPFLSIYHLCKEFFTNELTTRFSYSETNLTTWTHLERGIPFMFALLMTVYPILCKDPAAAIDLHFESKRDASCVTITPHSEVDLAKDVLQNGFIGALLSATLENSDFSITEEQADGSARILLSAKHISKIIESSTFNANSEFEIHCVFALFLSLCAQYEESCQ